MKFKYLKIISIILLFVFVSCGSQKTKQYANKTIQKGQKLFEAQCRACHEVHQDLVGPALAKINQKYEEKWLIDFIRNSQKMIQAGNEKAVAVYERYGQAIMPSFTMSDDDIKAILAYIRTESQSMD